MMNYFELEPEPYVDPGDQIKQLWFSLAFIVQLFRHLPVEDIHGADFIAETYPKTRNLKIGGFDNSDPENPVEINFELSLNRKTFFEIGQHSFLIHWGSRIQHPVTFAFWVDPLYWVFSANREIDVPAEFYTHSVN